MYGDASAKRTLVLQTEHPADAFAVLTSMESPSSAKLNTIPTRRTPWTLCNSCGIMSGTTVGGEARHNVLIAEMDASESVWSLRST